MQLVVLLACCCCFLSAESLEDHYRTLGLRPSAKAKDIRKRYRQLAKSLHPDKNLKDKGAVEKFHKLAAAYEVLGDAEKRRDYDFERRRPPPQQFHESRRQQFHESRRRETVRVFQQGRVYEVPIEDFLRFQGFPRPPPQEEESSGSHYFVIILAVLFLFASYYFFTDDRWQKNHEEQSPPPREKVAPIVVTSASTTKELKLEATRRGLNILGCAEKQDLQRLLGVSPQATASS